MNIEMNLSGLEEYQKRIKQAPDKAIYAAENAMKIFTIKVKSDVQKSLNTNFPPASDPGQPPHKRTGTLYRSVYNQIEKTGKLITGIVGDNAQKNSATYPEMLEFGTSKMSPRPYLRPAVEKNRNIFVEMFKKIFNGI
jgi:HK97 gp10 family phage protein